MAHSVIFHGGVPFRFYIPMWSEPEKKKRFHGDVFSEPLHVLKYFYGTLKIGLILWLSIIWNSAWMSFKIYNLKALFYRLLVFCWQVTKHTVENFHVLMDDVFKVYSSQKAFRKFSFLRFRKDVLCITFCHSLSWALTWASSSLFCVSVQLLLAS